MSFLSGWHISTCLSHQYHYVADAMNWTEAQTYCRQRYTDLATIQNTNDMNQLTNTVSSAGHSSEVWIGLYSYVDWQWSDGYTGIGADYKNWASSEPAFWDAAEYCVKIASDGTWTNFYCSEEYGFICYSGEYRFQKRK
uniref:C-type lectin domain-containing protein n=1 Tax=Amphilophus citrinellus TaxID=61819 RepID=A0A3Q0SQD4_AMPCI